MGGKPMAGHVTYLATRLRRAVGIASLLPRVFRLLRASAPGWSLAWAGLLVAGGILPAGQLYLVRRVVDRISISVARSAEGVGPTRLQSTLVLLALLAGTMVLMEILRVACGWVREIQAELLRDRITALIHERSIAADMAFYEWPENFDLLHRAREEAGFRPVALVDSLGHLLQGGITLAAMGAVLISFGPWLPAAMLASALPALVVVLYAGHRQHRWRMATTAASRRLYYYDGLLTGGVAAAELRIFGLGPPFQAAYRSLRARLRRERLALVISQGLAELGAGVLALAVAGGCLGWMVWRVVRGEATLGELALFYQAFQQGQGTVRRLLDGMGQFYANSLFLGNLFAFLDLKPQVIDPPHPVTALGRVERSIRFCNVTFRYPGNSRPSLANFDLEIPAGRVVALVGPNGAGKSTLIKLLCRFYDPDEGSIEVDGVDLRAMPLDGLRGLITVLFQEPVRYSCSVAESIAIGRREEATPGEIEAAARAAGADEVVDRLPGGYETLLGREIEGGTGLSGGEWQRIALARAFLRRAPILLLDEPTSAMDSWAEADWLERLRGQAAGRTVVIITHRFSTAMQADMIHVLADGKAVEAGSHEELLACGGRYAHSWSMQTER